MYTYIDDGEAYEYGSSDGLMTVIPAPDGLAEGNYSTPLLRAGMATPLNTHAPLPYPTDSSGRKVELDLADLRWLAENVTPLDCPTHERFKGIKLGMGELASCWTGLVLRVVRAPVMQMVEAALTIPHVEAFLALPELDEDNATPITLEIGVGWAALHDPATAQSVYGRLRGKENPWPSVTPLVTYEYQHRKGWPAAKAELMDIGTIKANMDGAPVGTVYYTDQEAKHVRVESTDGKCVQVAALKTVGEDT